MTHLRRCDDCGVIAEGDDLEAWFTVKLQITSCEKKDRSDWRLDLGVGSAVYSQACSLECARRIASSMVFITKAVEKAVTA